MSNALIYSDYAQIRATRDVIQFGNVAYPSYRFEWQGEQNQALVSGEMLWDFEARGTKPMNNQIGYEFCLGHLNLVIVDRDFERDLFTVALADGRAYQAAYARRIYYALQWFWVRFIITLHVWGFAYVPNGEIPSRRHIGKKRLY